MSEDQVPCLLSLSCERRSGLRYPMVFDLLSLNDGRTPNKCRFTSYERSDATVLDYAVNRHYDSQQGRFTQVDPAAMKFVNIANPQTLNLYAYCQ